MDNGRVGDADRAATPSGPSPQAVSGIAGIPRALRDRLAVALYENAYPPEIRSGYEWDMVPGYWHEQADAVLAEFATFLRERSLRKQARALDVELTIAEMLAASGMSAFGRDGNRLGSEGPPARPEGDAQNNARSDQ